MGLHPHLQGQDRGQCPPRAIGLEPMAPGWRDLRDLERACPIRIPSILTDNGKEFTDRLFGLRRRAATGAHAFDQFCAKLGIEHCLTPPVSPQTNGMVERFNGRIEAVLQGNHIRPGKDMETTLYRYVFHPG
jgi:transposase InsO family protein